MSDPERLPAPGALPAWDDSRPAGRADRSPAAEDRDEQRTNFLLLAVALCVCPAGLALAGYLVGDRRPDPVRLGTAAAVAALVAFLFARWQRHPVTGVLPGLLAGTGSYCLTLLFTTNKIQTDPKWAFAAALAGAMPGLGVYVLQVRRAFLRGSESPVSPLPYWVAVGGAVLLVAYLVGAAVALSGGPD